MPNHATATIVGHLGRDPETRQVGDKNVANFSVAVTKKRGQKETTTWFDVAAWGRLSDVCGNYLKKGSAVMVVGDLQMESFTKKDGTPGNKLSLDAQSIVLLGARSAGNEDAQEAPARPASAPALRQAQAAVAAGTKPDAGNGDEPPF